jgi:uncharacterized protein YwgA
MNDIFNNMKQSMERFFGTEPFKLARLNDPTTSHEAAQAVDSTKLEKMVYEAIKSHPEGCISDDILSMFPNYPYSSITARYRALLDKGFIEVSGVKRGKFGRNQRVMRAAK